MKHDARGDLMGWRITLSRDGGGAGGVGRGCFVDRSRSSSCIFERIIRCVIFFKNYERFFLLLRIGKTISGRIDQRNFLESIFRQVILYLVSIYFDLSESIDDSWKKKIAGSSYNLCIKIFMRIRAWWINDKGTREFDWTKKVEIKRDRLLISSFHSL